MSSYTNMIYDTPPLLQLFMIFVILMLALNIVFIVDLTMNHQATGQWHPTHTHTHTRTRPHTRWRIYVTFSDHIIGIMSKSVVERSVEVEPRRHGNTLIAIRVISDKEMVEIYVKNQLVSYIIITAAMLSPPPHTLLSPPPPHTALTPPPHTTLTPPPHPTHYSHSPPHTALTPPPHTALPPHPPHYSHSPPHPTHTRYRYTAVNQSREVSMWQSSIKPL